MGITTPLTTLGYDVLNRPPDYLRAFLDHLVDEKGLAAE